MESNPADTRYCRLHDYRGESRPYVICGQCSLVWVTREAERYMRAEWSALRFAVTTQG
jgi:hypothetical protein